MEILDLTREAFEEAVMGKGFARYKARQILRWIYTGHTYSFHKMSNLSKKDRSSFEAFFSISPLNIREKIRSEDGTEKLVFELDDGSVIESVIIPDGRRTTLCISTQVGCPLKCGFCKTGALGYKRDLTVREVTGQVLRASEYLKNKDKKITNIVYMGMGEPLLNFDVTVRSIIILMDDHGFNFSNKKITVSTAGITDKIIPLGEQTGVNLAVSLHAVTDEKRSKIMPLNEKYPVRELLDAVNKYPAHKRKRVVIEYLMLKNFNDKKEDGEKFAKMAKEIKAKVNLLPFNIYDGAVFEPTDMRDILKFQKFLTDRNVTALIRKSRGFSELAACGQLGGV